MPGKLAKPPTVTTAPAAPGPHTEELEFARGIVLAESRAVAGLADRLDENFCHAVGLIVGCADSGGTVLVTGLGKSGLIGAKISATMKSLGIPSHHIHPTEAAHGDLGAFRASDCCIAISYSGETDEVVALAATLRQDGIPLITMTRGALGPANPADSSAGSSLERMATASLTTGHVDEADGSLAPTCSTTAMLALGDALAIAASRRRCFTEVDFAKRHPGGALGGLLRPIASALRFTIGKNLSASPDHLTGFEALGAAESGVRRPGALLLIDSATGILTGIFTDADLRRLILKDPDQLRRPIRELMTRSPATLPHTALVRDWVQMVRETRRDEVPVVDEAGRPVGLLDVQDLIAMRLVRAD